MSNYREPSTDETTVFNIEVEWPDGGRDRHLGYPAQAAYELLRNKLGFPHQVIAGGLSHPGEVMEYPGWAGTAVAEVA